MKVGIIGSSGGSALIAAVECIQKSGQSVELVIVTDRPCGMELWANEKGIPHSRIKYLDAEQFSAECLLFFRRHDCAAVLLFYTRRVSSPLISEIDVWNIHPALLPAFRGLYGLKDAIDAGVQIYGATLHRVDDELDTGPIRAQVASGSATSWLEAQRLSYLHTVLLILIWYEVLSGQAKGGSRIYNWLVNDIIASPGISLKLLDETFRNLLENTPGIS